MSKPDEAYAYRFDKHNHIQELKLTLSHAFLGREYYIYTDDKGIVHTFWNDQPFEEVRNGRVYLVEPDIRKAARILADYENKRWQKANKEGSDARLKYRAAMEVVKNTAPIVEPIRLLKGGI